MKVVGVVVAKAMVPLLEFDETADGQLMVDFARVFDEIDEELKNGSFRPH